RQLDFRLEQRLAILGGFEPGELVEPRLEEIGRLEQDAAALSGGEVTPARRLEAGLSRTDGIVDIGRIPGGDIRQDRFRRRIDNGESLTRCRGPPLIVDEEICSHRITFRGTRPHASPGSRRCLPWHPRSGRAVAAARARSRAPTRTAPPRPTGRSA